MPWSGLGADMSPRGRRVYIVDQHMLHAPFLKKGEPVMEVDVLSQLIGNMGFPIACVIAMFYMWNREREDHKAESDKWVEAIHNNTVVMEKLLERMDK